MAEESDLERTEPASARRLEQAREEGQVPHSRELGAFLIPLRQPEPSGSWAGGCATRCSHVPPRPDLDQKLVHEPDQMLVRFSDLSYDVLLHLFAAAGAADAIAAVSRFSWNAFNVYSPKALVPNFTRLDPRDCSVCSRYPALSKWSRRLPRLLVGGMAAWVIWSERHDLITLLAQPVEVGLVLPAILLFQFPGLRGCHALIIVATMSPSSSGITTTS